MSGNGWTNDDLGFEWLQEMFEKHTASHTAGRYRLLILDGHSSHATTSIHGCAFSKANIMSEFAAAGLIPFKPERLLGKLCIKTTKTPTPPSSSSSNQSFYLGRTPANLYQLNQQKKQI